jgi:hypothetical protein
MSNKGPILAGALGGVAPNLIRLIVNYSSPNPQHIINQPVLYFLAMVGFAALGGVVAWAFQETNLKQALFLGVSLPSLFQIGALQGTPPSNPTACCARNTTSRNFTVVVCLRSSGARPFALSC